MHRDSKGKHVHTHTGCLGLNHTSKSASWARTLSSILVSILLVACYAGNGAPSATLGKTGNTAAPAISLAISPDALVAGQTAIATWDASGATSCKALGAWSGPLALSNTKGQTIGPFTESGTYSFTINCTGPGGTGAATQIITVGKVPAPTIQMDVEPGTIMPGGTATLTWSTTNAQSCTGSGGTPASGWDGSQATSNFAGFTTPPVANAGAYQFVLTCLGAGGSTQEIKTLIVSAQAPTPPPTVWLAAQPTQVIVGQSTTLSWTTANASGCAASGGAGAWGGNEPTSSSGTSSGALNTAGSYSFTLTCTGAGGVTAKSTTVVVTPTSAPPVTAVIIDVSPNQIPSGGSGYITWSTVNANACVASGSWSGVQQPVGILVSTGTLTTPGLYSFTLTCTGPGGSASGTATLQVAAPPAGISTLTATPTSIVVGQKVTLSWTTNNATACTGTGGSPADGWQGAQATSSAGLQVGPINTAGAYVYTLDCTGPGGTGLPQSVLVTVTPVTPVLPTVTAFAVLPATIQVGQSATLNWVTLNAASCTASGGTGSDGWNGSVGTQSVGTSTGPIATAGSYTYTLTCAGPGGNSAPASVVLNVNSVAPGPAQISSFAVNPLVITTGQSATLSWMTGGATSCTGSGGTGSDGWSGTQPVSSSGSSTGVISTAGVYLYTLTCTGPGGTSLPRTATLTVTTSLNAAAVTSFTVTPGLIQTGQSATLAWTSTNATACTASGGTGSWSGSEPLSSAGTSTGVINTAGIYTYILTCSGASGSAGPSSVTLVVAPTITVPATIVAFSVTPGTIQTGQSALLTWVTANAASCTASGGTGTWGGSVPTTSVGTSTGVIATAGSYTYTLNCTGPGGASSPSSVVLNVTSAPPPLPVISAFAAAPATVLAGGSTTLTWVTVGATSCTATGGTGSDGWNGSVGIAGVDLIGPLNTAGVYTYTLTCSGPGGTSQPTSVTVDVDAIPPAPVIQSFTVSPSTVQQGGTVTAVWSTANATSCTASGGTPGDGWSGAEPAQSTGTSIGPVSIIGVALYSLSCTGPGGQSLPSVASVLVTATAPAAAILSFTASPSALQTGQSATLSWTTSNATSCTASGGTGAAPWSGSAPTSSSTFSSGTLSTAGVYNFTLTCTGPGGTSLPAATAVTVTSAPPPVTITSFTATPMILLSGQSSSLAWTTNGATACTASGGSGSDGWGGTVAPASTGTSIGPLNSIGVYVYSLVCTGPGGTSLPASAIVTVVLATPAATINSFTANPTVVQAGQSTSLSWSTGNATSCTAGGGTGSDGWTGTVGTSSTGMSIGPLSAGSITYTLTCSGPGGSSAPNSLTVVVNPATPPAPIVTLVANGASPATVAPGGTLTLAWSSTNATSCTASGGSSSNWSGTQSLSSTGISVTPVTVPGVYSYTLTCSGTGGSGSSTVQVTVMPTQSYDCGIPGMPTQAMVSPAASVATSLGGVCLLDCSVSNAGNVIDSNPSNYAGLSIPLGVLGNASLDVTDTSTFPAGRSVGFIVANGQSVLDLGLINGITIRTYLNGSLQDTAAVGSLLTLDAVGLLSVDPDAGFVEFKTTKSFNQVQLIAGSLVGLNSSLRVYSACVSEQ
jgi:hypothetical protein